MVKRVRNRKSTKDLFAQAGSTVSLGKGAVTTVRNAAHDTSAPPGSPLPPVAVRRDLWPQLCRRTSRPPSARPPRALPAAPLLCRHRHPGQEERRLDTSR